MFYGRLVISEPLTQTRLTDIVNTEVIYPLELSKIPQIEIQINLGKVTLKCAN